MADNSPIDLLRENMRLYRLPIIVIGAGVSAGAGVPTMNDIHVYLAKGINAESSRASEVAASLLRILQSDQTESPRSVSVRLYRLMQATDDPHIRSIWAQFGRDLLKGSIKSQEEKESDQKKAEPRPLWTLDPTGAHKWAAGLALSGRAMIVSLNFDGLTRLALGRVSGDAKVPRILSDEEAISVFFTGEEGGVKSECNESDVTPVPVIKFRGDVFHALCDNGRCPSYGKLQPLYDLLRERPKRTSHKEEGTAEAVHEERGSNGEQTNNSSETTSALLRCGECGRERRLQLSFPGIAAKEQQITRAVAALHQYCGNRIAGVFFLGFSGRWDESLTRYLIRRAAALEAPIFSVGEDKTRFIEMEASAAGAKYEFRHADFGDKRSDEMLCSIIRADEKIGQYERALSATTVSFPHEAFGVWQEDSVAIKLRDREGGKRTLTVNSSPSDGFAGVAAEALASSKDLQRLRRCSQLGPKSKFLLEASADRHNRLQHSAEAALIAMIWFEALLPQANRNGVSRWAPSSDARLALDMAVLFHDARHLPFSHMMEEVFRELNWADVPPLGCPSFTSLTEAVERTAKGEPAWWSSRVEAIQRGRSGVPWLEAITDSALDADKIAYVFNDSSLTGQGVRLSGIHPWIEAFVGGQHLTPEGLIRLEGAACEASLALLEERMHLYQRIYLAPELRALECLVRYIVTTWLEWKVPEKLGSLLTDEGATIEKTARGPTTRALKTTAASELLWEKFEASDEVNEVTVLGSMVGELEESALDKPAIEWLKACWKHLEPFIGDAKSEKPSMVEASRAYRSLAPVGPVYFHARHLEPARRIARRWRVHFPCAAIVDMVKLPKFLSTPENRLWQNSSEQIIAEQFLVPNRNPSQWHRGGKSTVPLHVCDFSAFEQPVVQVLVVDPLGSPSSASHFLYDMMKADLEAVEISLFESPEEAKAAATGS